jgi:hypothetical protein
LNNAFSHCRGGFRRGRVARVYHYPDILSTGFCDAAAGAAGVRQFGFKKKKEIGNQMRAAGKKNALLFQQGILVVEFMA